MAKEALARERLFALREAIARLEGRPIASLHQEDADILAKKDPSCSRNETGGEQAHSEVPALDAVLPGGLPRAGMAEIRTHELRNAGASTGLALAFCGFLAREEEARGTEPAFLFIGEASIAREAGEPFAAGLVDHGVFSGRFLQARPRRLKEALWLAEAAIASRAFRAIILEIAGNPQRFGLAESRRLNLRARHAGSLLLLLRQGGEEEAGSTLFRLEATPAPSAYYRLPDGRSLEGTIGAPGFALRVEKSPDPALPPLSTAIAIEWNAHERLFTLPDSSTAPVRNPAHSNPHLSKATDRPDRASAMGSILDFTRAS